MELVNEKNRGSAWMLNHVACQNDCNDRELNLHLIFKPLALQKYNSKKVLMMHVLYTSIVLMHVCMK